MFNKLNTNLTAICRNRFGLVKGNLNGSVRVTLDEPHARDFIITTFIVTKALYPNKSIYIQDSQITEQLLGKNTFLFNVNLPVEQYKDSIVFLFDADNLTSLIKTLKPITQAIVYCNNTLIADCDIDYVLNEEDKRPYYKYNNKRYLCQPVKLNHIGNLTITNEPVYYDLNVQFILDQLDFRERNEEEILVDIIKYNFTTYFEYTRYNNIKLKYGKKEALTKEVFNIKSVTNQETIKKMNTLLKKLNVQY